MKTTGVYEKRQLKLLGNPDMKRKAPRPSFSAELECQQAKQVAGSHEASTVSGSETLPGKIQQDGKRQLICLGTLSRQNPSVSHLLLRNPDYRKRCWELINADQNKEKTYTSLPPGKSIYLNPETEEILWDIDSPRSHSPDFRPPPITSSLTSPEGASKVSETTAGLEQVAPLPKPERKAEPPAVQQIAGAGKADGSSSLAGKLVKHLRSLIGTSYKRLNCYELVVKGLKELGVQYRGRGGLQGHLIQKALDQSLPLNSYLTGDGLIEASAVPVYSRTFEVRHFSQEQADQIWKEVLPLLEPGLLVSFSTPQRGHTGIIAHHKKHWTFINSGYMDHDIHSPVKKRRVGEEDLKAEIGNWLRVAQRRREPLRIHLGRLNEQKLSAFRNDSRSLDSIKL